MYIRGEHGWRPLPAQCEKKLICKKIISGSWSRMMSWAFHYYLSRNQRDPVTLNAAIRPIFSPPQRLFIAAASTFGISVVNRFAEQNKFFKALKKIMIIRILRERSIGFSWCGPFCKQIVGLKLILYYNYGVLSTRKYQDFPNSNAKKWCLFSNTAKKSPRHFWWF